MIKWRKSSSAVTKSIFSALSLVNKMKKDAEKVPKIKKIELILSLIQKKLLLPSKFSLCLLLLCIQLSLWWKRSVHERRTPLLCLLKWLFSFICSRWITVRCFRSRELDHFDHSQCNISTLTNRYTAFIANERRVLPLCGFAKIND